MTAAQSVGHKRIAIHRSRRTRGRLPLGTAWPQRARYRVPALEAFAVPHDEAGMRVMTSIEYGWVLRCRSVFRIEAHHPTQHGHLVQVVVVGDDWTGTYRLVLRFIQPDHRRIRRDARGHVLGWLPFDHAIGADSIFEIGIVSALTFGGGDWLCVSKVIASEFCAFSSNLDQITGEFRPVTVEAAYPYAVPSSLLISQKVFAACFARHFLHQHIGLQVALPKFSRSKHIFGGK